MELFTVEFPSDWDFINVYSLSDIHESDPLFDVDMFRRFIKFIAEDKRRRIIGNGDWLNNALKTSVSNIYNEVRTPSQARKWMIKEVEPIADQIDEMIEGNHERRSTKETDQSPTEWMADVLKVPYFENGVFAKYSLGKGANGKRIAYGICVTHGSSGGKKIGSPLNRGEDFIARIENCDLLALGHSHKLCSGKIGTIVMDLQNNRTREIEKGILVSSHWSHFGGYAFRGMMPPSAKGAAWATLSGKEKKLNITI